jgi:hypothetical protein
MGNLSRKNCNAHAGATAMESKRPLRQLSVSHETIRAYASRTVPVVVFTRSDVSLKPSVKPLGFGVDKAHILEVIYRDIRYGTEIR